MDIRDLEKLYEVSDIIQIGSRNMQNFTLLTEIGKQDKPIMLKRGIAATISPITFLTENIIDIMVLVVFSGLVWAFAWTKKQLDKKEGIIMLVLYAIYTVYIIMR